MKIAQNLVNVLTQHLPGLMLLSDKFKYHINSARCTLYFAPSKTEVSALSSMFAAINNDLCKN